MHNCEECGLSHEGLAEVQAGQALEPAAEVITEETAETVTEAAVQVAQIEGDTAVKLAKISAGVAESEIESRISTLEGELRGMREVLDRMAPAEPEAAPEAVAAPVVVQEADPEPEMPPRETEGREKKGPSSRKGFF